MNPCNTRIKICGLRRPEDIEYVNECLPDYAGFVFADSRRKVSAGDVARLREKLDNRISVVGVFVNEDVQRVAWLVNEGIIDIAQLHGDEDSYYIFQLRYLLKRGKIIKAVRVQSPRDIAAVDKLPADYLLFDKFSPDAYGGTGETFDWSIITDIRKPFFLAGGIRTENVEQALEQVHPYAVDLSSAVETEGYKDRNKMIDIVNKIREIG